jgi:hypothetical protein
MTQTISIEDVSEFATIWNNSTKNDSGWRE